MGAEVSRHAALVAVLCAIAGMLPAGTAEAAPPCVTPTGVYREPAKWAQRLTDARPSWPLTEGAGQLVAVVGTGVDPTNAQLAGRVSPIGAAADDCDGRGTFAAGIVAAQPDPATTFAGMAPGARILAVKYTESASGGAGGDADPDRLAEAITASVGAGATVILVVLPTLRTSPALDTAVRDALSANVVVVSPAMADKAGVRSYPTSVAGVLGVGAVDDGGSAVQQEAGPYVALAAPGADVVGTSAKTSGAVGHIWGLEDRPPIYAAAAFVAGAAALIRDYHPSLDPAGVADRLVATASRPPSGGRDPLLGWGILDVNAAVAAELSGSRSDRSKPNSVVPAAAPAAPAPHERLPGWVAVIGVGLAVLAVISVRIARRGRARGWRP